MRSGSVSSAASYRPEDRRPDVLLARLASAALLAPLVLLFVWWGGWPFVALVAAVAVWSTLEYARLLEQAGRRPAWPVGLIGAACLAAAPAVPGTHLGALAMAVALLGPGVYLLAEAAPVGPGAVQDWALTTLGSLLVGWPLAQAVALRQPPEPTTLLGLGAIAGQPVTHGLLLALVVLTCTWASDSAAYGAGRLWGRRPFFAAISPRKTLEGAAAGLVAPTLVALAWAPPLGWPLPFAIVLGASAGVAALAGDLLESALKRSVGAKDAGWLIPGHGGLLDRVDGLLLVLVAVALLTGEVWP
jgi:phosphatidate cytidylyltransferase